jgi:hypothetical protein
MTFICFICVQLSSSLLLMKVSGAKALRREVEQIRREEARHFAPLFKKVDLSAYRPHADRALTDATPVNEGPVGKRSERNSGEDKGGHGDYEIGRGRPPKAFRWKKGQSGKPGRELRRPPKDAELIERLFRRMSAVIEGGEKVRKTGFEIIFAQLMTKESAGDRGAAKTRDRYQRFAFAHQATGGVLLRYAETEFTRAFSADWRRGRESKGQGDAEPGSSQAPIDLGEEDSEALKAMKP